MCLACEELDLGYRFVAVFIFVSLVKRSFCVLGQNRCVVVVVCLACEDVVLGYGCVCVYIVVSVVKRSI